MVSIPMLVLALIPIGLLVLAAAAITAYALVVERVPSGAVHFEVSRQCFAARSTLGRLSRDLSAPGPAMRIQEPEVVVLILSQRVEVVQPPPHSAEAVAERPCFGDVMGSRLQDLHYLVERCGRYRTSVDG